jgi:hypothetical protein
MALVGLAVRVELLSLRGLRLRVLVVVVAVAKQPVVRRLVVVVLAVLTALVVRERQILAVAVVAVVGRLVLITTAETVVPVSLFSLCLYTR